MTWRTKRAASESGRRDPNRGKTRAVTPLPPWWRKKRAHPKLVAQIEAAEAEGWTFGLASGGHVAGFAPDGVRRWTASATPSDWRAHAKAASDLRRARAATQGG